MELVFKSDTKQRKFRFMAQSFAHPAKLVLPLQLWLIEHYTKPGDWILDPMGGSGTLLVACSLSRNVILVELEEKFVQMQKDNWKRVQEVGCELGHTMGQAVIMQGDARNLEGVMADCIISSPPYASGGHHADQTGAWGGQAQALSKEQANYGISEGQIGQLPYGNPDVIISSPPYAGEVAMQDTKFLSKKYEQCHRSANAPHAIGIDKYSDNPSNLGNLRYGDISAIITSPPYEGSEARDRSKEDWWDEEREKKFSGGSAKIAKGYQPDAIITSPPYEERHSYPDIERERHAVEKLKAHPNSKIGGVRIHEHESDNPSNIGNLKGSTYLEAMVQVYSQCYAVLKDGGLLILVVKNFIRDKKIVPLDEHTIKLCEQVGFQFVERHYRTLTQQSFWRTIYKQRFPDAPEIKQEDILVFQKTVMPLEVR